MDLVNIAFIKALGITLFHSIWQATLIALVMSIVLSVIKKKYAKERYLIALSSLFVLFITSIYTFSITYQSTLANGILTEDSQFSESFATVIMLYSEEGLVEWLKNLMMKNIQWITLLWCIGLFFFLFKIIYGLQHTRNIESSAREIKVQWLTNMLEDLKGKAKVDMVIKVKESIKILQPSVIGIIKPAIYFPIGLVNSIDPREAEAILAHELAHIIRNDFLINIVQSIIETFYYFHPAVWWISANIRCERENACDDLAIDIIGDKVQYAKSLLVLQALETNVNPGLAMTLTSKNTPLFDRMKRILNQPYNKHEMKQKIFATIILMSSIIWISATESPVLDDHQEQVSEETLTLIQDELPPVRFVNNDIEADTIPKDSTKSKSMIVEVEDGEIKRLNIDGKEIPEEEFDDHSIIVDELGSKNTWHFNSNDMSEWINLENIDEMKARMHIYHDSIWPSLSQNFQFHKLGEDDHNYIFFNGEDSDSSWNEIRFPHGNYQFQFDRLDTLRLDMDSLRSKMGKLKIHLGEVGERFEFMMDSIDFPRMGSEFKFRFDSLDFSHIHESFKHLDTFRFPDFDHSFSYLHPGNLQHTLLQQLKKDGLYKEGGNEIKLSYDRLEINGEKQSETLLKKYKQLYEKRTGVDFLQGTSLNIVISKDSENQEIKRL
ncbi:M56 family metallopeptidase [Portibacter marinus]|uniref:M56 family metallopeptidase n=1 Tax=Portibacter marinus TaxID=2898660 RepID=UPI001F241E6B|nr:M56 family metallopeptidase [Portibacter marinus]